MRVLGLLLALLLAACAKPLPPGVTQLSYSTPYSPNHPFSRADQIWMAYVERASGGSLKIVPRWSGAVLSADMSMEELRHGVADIGLVTPIYAKGGAQLLRTQAGFYSGVTTIPQQVALYRCIAAASPRIAEELKGLKVLAVQGGSMPGLVTRDRPVTRLSDLKGLRLRVPGELGVVLGGMGVDTVNMPMGEVYSSMAKGVVDGVAAGQDAIKSLHFAEVAHHYTTLRIPRGAYPARAMGTARWNRLSPEQQLVLERGVAVWEAAIASEIEKSLGAGIAEARAKNMQIHAIAPADQTAFDARYLADAERNAQRLSASGIDAMAAFRAARASIGPGGNVSCRT
ncbi:TRAP transporter substrate-binding protein DctP [Sphingomonas sp. SUN039]|uniref:TRAP transporter substrate-binding protein DctP n=1 Tax=Sphingomonas sp. SUN039 TaxID=2937787 RepID=UPI002164E831|nr:TRAP transporter substrate-binding protein DctP [Sphingomonas sp. SUN039]UVO54389.1 TRAP transporter substrate-binding protein DctP [Sphingomonas sp. SUN039]